MIIFISNNVNFHFEIIESIIIQYSFLLKKKFNNPIIYLFCKKNKSFENYIQKKYPSIFIGIPSRYDYYINCSIYSRDLKKIKRDKKHFYISHEYNPLYLSIKNVYFVFPKCPERFLSLHYLPFREEKRKNNIPIYIIQGNLNHGFRRNFHLLVSILEKSYSYLFKIKIIGSGKLPKILQPFQEKIILKNNLDFQEFHREFLDGYAILPLISKEKQKHYYTFKLTSTMNYAKAYNLKCIMDSELFQLYPLENSEVYSDDNDIFRAFQKTLQDFYEKN